MSEFDKKAFKLGMIAAVIAFLIPLLLQTVLTAAPLAAGVT